MKNTNPVYFNRRYPAIEDLRKQAKKKIPRFAFEYLDGGCNEDINLKKNTSEIREIELQPTYVKPYREPTLKTTLFGQQYDTPFGVAPIGLQGLMWPNAPEILARAAHKYNIPFILSTVSTATIEKVSELTEGKAWFQLYHPAKIELRDQLLERAKTAGCEVLVVLCDVPVFGYRPRDIRNGLSMPPNMTLSNIIQIMQRPEWALRTLLNGQPNFELLKPYMPKGLDLRQLGKFMDQTFSGYLDEDRLKALRDKWKGKLVLKGVASTYDAEIAIKLGLDGIIVSNHGGRQADVGPSSIKSLQPIIEKYQDQITIMMDSGIRSGTDIARTLAVGAQFTFLGRSFMYGVSALGKKGGEQTIQILLRELKQVMHQLGAAHIDDLSKFIIHK